MKLPHREKAYIPQSKLRDYLLSETHPVGRSKARFLRKIGFDENNIEQLAHELLRIAGTQDITEAISSPFGVKYIINGLMMTPAGQSAAIQTVWIIDTGQEIPRFVTAYPN